MRRLACKRRISVQQIVLLQCRQAFLRSQPGKVLIKGLGASVVLWCSYIDEHSILFKREDALIRQEREVRPSPS